MLERIRNAREQSLGFENEKTLQAATALAHVYLAAGKNDQAIQLQRKIGDASEDLFGHDSDAAPVRRGPNLPTCWPR